MIAMQGDKGSKVVEIQKRLIELGYELPIYGSDGDFGNETRSAVWNFQSDVGIDPTGMVDETTYSKLMNSSKVIQSSNPVDSVPLSIKYPNMKKYAVYAVIGLGVFGGLYLMNQNKKA